MPTSDQWIRKMTAPVRENDKIFSIGFSGYEVKSTLLNKWIQFETMLTALFLFFLWTLESAVHGCRKEPMLSKKFLPGSQGIQRTLASRGRR